MGSTEMRETLNNTWNDIVFHPHTKSWFFQRLFEMSPQLRPVIMDDPDGSSHCILNFILTHLRHLEQERKIRLALRDYKLHKRLQPRDYGYLKKALIITIHDIMGAEFTPFVGEVWDTALTEISVIMMEDTVFNPDAH